VLGGADGPAGGGRRAGLARDRGRRAGQHRDRADPAGNGDQDAATAKLTAPGHDLGHVYLVAAVSGRLQRPAQGGGV
jgi:hypothetical protein